MAGNITETISIKNDEWTQLSDVRTKILLNSSSVPYPNVIFYVFSETLPDADVVIPSHRYTPEEYSEGIILGSNQTDKLYARLSPKSNSESIDVYVTRIDDYFSSISKGIQDEWTDLGFCFQYNQVVDFPDSGTSNKYFLINATNLDDNKVLHVSPILFNNLEDGPAYVNLYPLSDYSGGDPVIITNRNGNFSDPPDISITEDPTGTTVGVLKAVGRKIATGGALPSQSGGGSSVKLSPTVVPKGSKVLIEIVNGSGNTIDGEIFIEFCEVPVEYN